MNTSDDEDKHTALHDLLSYVSDILEVKNPFSVHRIPYSRIEKLTPFYKKNIQYFINLGIVGISQVSRQNNKEWCRYITKQIYSRIGSELEPNPNPLSEPGYILVNYFNEYMRMQGGGKDIFDFFKW